MRTIINYLNSAKKLIARQKNRQGSFGTKKSKLIKDLTSPMLGDKKVKDE